MPTSRLWPLQRAVPHPPESATRRPHTGRTTLEQCRAASLDTADAACRPHIGHGKRGALCAAFLSRRRLVTTLSCLDSGPKQPGTVEILDFAAVTFGEVQWDTRFRYKNGSSDQLHEQRHSVKTNSINCRRVGRGHLRAFSFHRKKDGEGGGLHWRGIVCFGCICDCAAPAKYISTEHLPGPAGSRLRCDPTMAAS